MKALRLLPVLFTLFLFVDSASAQDNRYTFLYGSVVSDSTGEPLAGAHVFIANSMMGTTTDNAGRYRLDAVPLGAHRLYVTTVGYTSIAKDVLLREGGEQQFDFRLKPAVIELGGEVVVEAKKDKRWQERYEKFVRLFIGETPSALGVKILNPEVLDFEDKVGRFVAKASETLIIENETLGYRIQYFLKEFGATPNRTWYDGEPLFEEMTADSPQQEAMWRENRKNAFMGSFRHFALALLAGRLDEQGFKIFSRPSMMASDNVAAAPMAGGRSNRQMRFPVKPEEIFSDGANPNEKTLDFHGAVEIMYLGEYEDPSYNDWLRKSGNAAIKPNKDRYQTSWIQLEKGPTILDYKGDIADPYGVTFMGYLAFERVADEVPKEYRPR